MTEPVVSVILIGYNDAARIGRALESIRNQTMRSIEIIVVDDASTDTTANVVQAIADKDPRISLLRRTENSGGCSAPRNDGLEVARGEWVMFCDSDDELDIHACANLWTAAQEWDADVVCGCAVRHDVRKGGDKRWRPELHARDRLVTSLESEPDLLYDTISVNKIYRRELLLSNHIEFPPGLLFEDQVFTLRCYLAARRIGILQATVYIWNVDRAHEELSITQGRMQRRNVLDRVQINREMDRILDEESPNLREAKDIKFLRHEGYLYLWAIAENPHHDDAESAAESFASYVRTVDPRAFLAIRPALRVAMYGLLTRDLELLRRAMRWERWASVVDTRIVEVGDRQFWQQPVGRELLGHSDAFWLDVTRLHLLDMPFSTRRYFHELRSLTVTRSKIDVSVSTADYAGDLDPSFSAELVWIDKAGSIVASLPLVRSGEEAGSRIVWRGAGQPSVHIDRPLMKPDKGSVGIRLSRGAGVNITALRVPDPGRTPVFLPLPSIAFADRPSGIAMVGGERASLAWRPSGRSRGPVAWGRRLGHAARRRLPGASEHQLGRAREALLPGVFDLPVDRPIVAYIPAASAAGERARWPMDLSAWEEQMADQCYLLAFGAVKETIPTRLWGAIRDARRETMGRVVGHASVVITDDPALIDTVGDSIVFRPDDGAGRYLLPVLPTGYPVIETLEDLVIAVRAALGVPS